MCGTYKQRRFIWTLTDRHWTIYNIKAKLYRVHSYSDVTLRRHLVVEAKRYRILKHILRKAYQDVMKNALWKAAEEFWSVRAYVYETFEPVFVSRFAGCDVSRLILCPLPPPPPPCVNQTENSTTQIPRFTDQRSHPQSMCSRLSVTAG